MAAVLHFYSQFWQERPSPYCFGLCEPRGTKTGKVVVVCSSVDEKKNRRSKVLKMMQRRNKPIATPRGKGYNESKFSRHEEKPVVTRREQYHETNERHDLKTWNLRHEDSRQKLEEQFSKRRSVCGSMKSKYRFCPRPDVIQRVSSITSRCSANEPALGLERAAEIEHGYVWTGPKWQRKRKGAIIARAKGKNADGE